MIEFEDVDGWWSDFSDLVSFDPTVLQELLYSRGRAISLRNDGMRHGEVAEALEELVGRRRARSAPGAARDRAPVRAGRRAACGRRPCSSQVAETTFAEGADRETALHAGKALDAPRHRGRPRREPETERLFARAALLLLLGGEPSWRADTGGAERLFALADDAERAAEACGDAQLRAGATLRERRSSTLAYGGARRRRRRLPEAVERRAGGGRRRDGVRRPASARPPPRQRRPARGGRRRWRRRSELLASGRLAERLDPDALDARAGPARLDAGGRVVRPRRVRRGGPAPRERRADPVGDPPRRRLRLGALLPRAAPRRRSGCGTRPRSRCARRSPSSRRTGGRSAPAATSARCSAASASSGTRSSSTSRGASWRRDGARRTRRGTCPSEPLVDVYWAELLLAEGTEAARREADELLAAAPNYGWARSEIAMASLRARIALAEGRLDDALVLSSAAYNRLDGARRPRPRGAQRGDRLHACARARRRLAGLARGARVLRRGGRRSSARRPTRSRTRRSATRSCSASASRARSSRRRPSGRRA